MRLDWSDGFKKVGKKARRGRKKKNRPLGHASHHKKLPSPYDRDNATERRRRIVELREHDLDSEID